MVDPLLIAAHSACHLDDQCPCGAHCALGLCAADCTTAAECATGDYCDSFGRCRLNSDTGLIGVAPTVQPSITLRPKSLQLSVGDTAMHSVDLAFPGLLDAGPVRVHPDPGLLLTCPDGGGGPNDAGDCIFTASADQRFSVSLQTPSDGGVAQEVHIYTGGQIQTVTVARAPPPTTALGAPTAGPYAGSAQLVSLFDAAAGVDAGIGAQTVAISAWVGTVNGALALEIDDPSHTLFPADAWTGPITQSGSAYTVQLPAFTAILDTLLPDTDAGAPDVDVILAPQVATLTATTGSAPALSFELAFMANGIFANAGIPGATYAISLGAYTGDAGPTHTLGLTTGAASTLDPTLAGKLSPWGSAFYQSLTPIPSTPVLESNLVDPTLLALAQGMIVGDGGPYDDCGRSWSPRTAPDFFTIYYELQPLTNFDDPAALGWVTNVAHQVDLFYTELTIESNLPIPAGSTGLVPFTWDGGFTFATSKNVAWQAEAYALAQTTFGVDTSLVGNVASGTAELTAIGNSTNVYAPIYNQADPSIPCAYATTAGTLAVTEHEVCQFQDYECAFNPTDPTGNYKSVAVQVPVMTSDSCAEMAAQFGCTPTDVNQPVQIQGGTDLLGYDAGGNAQLYESLATMVYQETVVTQNYTGPGDTETWSVQWNSDGLGTMPTVNVTRVCVANLPSDCIDRNDCAAPIVGQSGMLTSADLGAAQTSTTGDLECQYGGFAADFSLDQFAGTGDAGAPALLTACQQELGALHSELPPAVTTTGEQALLGLLPDATCVQGGREIENLELALWYANVENPYGQLTTDVVPERAQTEVLRTLQRWIKLHAFVAREQIEREPMTEVYAALNAPDPLGATLTVQQDLDLSLAGWTLLLHPHFSPVLTLISGTAYAFPDYRDQVIAGLSATSFDQGEGLPVAMLEALDAQVELATLGVNDVWHASTPPDLTQLPGLEKVLYYVAAIRPLAVQIEETAAAAASPAALSWLPAYLTASNALDARIASLNQALANARTGQSPLGLSPNQVPLYFSGSAAGAGGEFSAISDYLLGGYPNDTTAWAPALVAQAQTDLTAAESAYEQQVNRQLEGATVSGTAEALEIQYGNQLLNLCGTIPDSNGNPLTAANVLTGASSFLNGATCYQVQSSACLTPPQELLNAYTADDLAYQICVVSQIQAAAGNVAASFADTGLNALAAAGGCTAGTDVYQPSGCAGGGACLTCSVGGQQLTVAINANSPQPQLGAADTTTVDANARGVCSSQFPNAVDPLPSPATVNPNQASGSCFQGSLGQEALQLMSVQEAIEIARSQYADQMDAYYIAMQSCLILDQGDAQIQTATTNFDNTMANMREGKLIEDSIADVAGAAVACASAASNVVGDADGSTAAACGAAAVEAAAQIASEKIQNEMDNAQASHDALVQQLQDSIATQQCANNATQYEVGLRTQALVIQQSIDNFNAAQHQFNSDQGNVQQLLQTGQQQLAAYQSQGNVAPGFDFWLNADIDQYTHDFALAQRATFLAVRAAEYEFQATLVDANASVSGTTYEAEVVAAKVPTDLTNVINGMLEITGTGGILGNQPSQLSVIFSMRDALLQLYAQSGQLDTQHGLTAGQQFDELLASSKYAVYDQNGNYQGQQIPFSLAPLGAATFGITNNGGISIFTGDSCAERIWTVYAAVEGVDGGAVYVNDSTATFAQVNLLKSNTFYSQWCARPSPDGTQLQQATVDPGVNLFEDPTQGAPSQINAFGTSSTEIQYTPARLEAFFNVTPTELSQETYNNGQSNELATRGLYGNYALFIPAGQISLPSQTGAGVGLDLNAIDDILLRIDYVSVAD